MTRTLRGYLRLLRPHQWTKNLFCMGGAIFGDHGDVAGALALDTQVFIAFCCLASAIYVINDAIDRPHDRLHPTKRSRPLASGEVSLAPALVLALTLMIAGFALCARLPPRVVICLGLYLINNLAYSLWLKHVPLLDVLSISLGFILRLLAGVYVLALVPTTWIVLCTLFLSLFLALAKRRAELIGLTASGGTGRPVLRHYSVEFVDMLLGNTATMCVLCYALFTVNSDKNPTLVCTVPVVYYVVAYVQRQLVHAQECRDPDVFLIRSPVAWISAATWLVLYLAISVSDVRLFR